MPERHSELNVENKYHKSADLWYSVNMKKKTLTKEQLLAKLRAAVNEAGSQAKLAKVLGVNPQYLNDVLMERRDISKTFAEKIGYMRLEVYVPDDNGETQ